MNLNKFFQTKHKLMLTLAVIFILTSGILITYVLKDYIKTTTSSNLPDFQENDDTEVDDNDTQDDLPDDSLNNTLGSAPGIDYGYNSEDVARDTPSSPPVDDTPSSPPVGDTPSSPPDDEPSCTVTGTWVESGSNPLASGGGTTSGVNRVYYPSVVKDSLTYHLWYGDGVNIRHAASTSYDFSTATFPAPIVTGLVKTSSVYHARVLYDSDGWIIGGTSYLSKFLMYSAPDFSQIRISYSDDGDAWTDIGTITGPVFAPGSIYNWIPLKDGANSWKAYGMKLNRTDYYTSVDGLAWTEVSTNVLAGGVGWESNPSYLASDILKIDSTYYLYYNAGVTADDAAIGLVTSPDGATWTRSPTNPIFSITDGIAWRNSRTYNAVILRDGATCRMYYSGKSTATGKYTIGVASQ